LRAGRASFSSRWLGKQAIMMSLVEPLQRPENVERK